MSHIKRSLPYLQAIKSVRSVAKRKQLLHHFPRFVVDDIAEIIYNIIVGNVHVSPTHKRRLSKIKRYLYDIIRSRNKRVRRVKIYKQSGTGIFTIILPALAAAVSALVSNA